uniref:Uncharacterized protein n=1 Tax=Coccolithus braarudii TaxID=221442 RepID=A0A7S0PWH5_9EUKA|mmetsp:Transcript_10737/g.23360  ORF Transcript_10737/g.23360 Transcript_10737/m.23360 type:complete len:174 (+) Transcript_10737:87-608(+)
MQALHLSSIAAGFQAALDAGMGITSHGSLRAAIHAYVDFCRANRSTNHAAFTFDRATAFFTMPAGGEILPPAEGRWIKHVMLQTGFQNEDTLPLTWIVNMLPCCWTRSRRRYDSVRDSETSLLVSTAVIGQTLAGATTSDRLKAAGFIAFLNAAIPSAILFRPILERHMLQII